MPYVQVWVDLEEFKGDCEFGTKAHDAMVDSLKKLRDGDHLGAIRILGEVTGDRVTKSEREKEKDLAALYAAWLDEPAPRPDFLTFAHHRRKATAA